MKILLVDFNYANLNRTVELWKLAWAGLGEVTFFGPGYVAEESWATGVARFTRKHGPFDVAVAAELLSSALNVEQSAAVRARALDRGYRLAFSPIEALRHCQRNYEEWMGLDTIRILSMLEFDAYNMAPSHFARIAEADHFIVGWGAEFIRPISKLPLLEMEEFGGSANDRWHDLTTQQSHRLISSPALVAEDEFCWTAWERRKHRWAVQGARYHQRQQAKEQLRRAGIPFAGRWQPYVLAAAQRMDRRALARGPLVTLLQYDWADRFRKSRVAYTCGSALGFPLRKYFEIPASGALLVAEPCNGMAALGFDDGLNFLSAGGRDLADIDRQIQVDTSAMEEIAKRGQATVWDAHRIEARARQYRSAVDSIHNGTFKGSRWIEGRFELL